MKILALIIPFAAVAVCNASSASAEQAPPQAFRGEWNSRTECGRPDGESRLIIADDSLEFYESAGPILGAFSNDPHEVLIVANTSGEGETSIEAYRFRLSDDGQILSQLSESSEPFNRYRCPTTKTPRRP